MFVLQPLADQAMQAALDQLSTGSSKLHEMCDQPAPEETSDSAATFTQEVIHCAYVIAKAAKQLVIMFE